MGTSGNKHVLGTQNTIFISSFENKREFQLNSFRAENWLIKCATFLSHQCKLCKLDTITKKEKKRHSFQGWIVLHIANGAYVRLLLSI